MTVDELFRHYSDDLHMDEDGIRPPHEVLLESFRNGNRKDVVAWFVCRTAEQPGYALATLSEFSRLATRDEIDTLQNLMPEDT
jgi:hypothetical protein